jgi:hypothetical protein
MLLRPFFAVALAALLAQVAVAGNAAAQPAPAPSTGPSTAPPGGTWGTGIPGGQPAAQPGVQPAPYPAPYPPGAYPPPGYPPGAYPYPPPGYPPGAYPPGPYPGAAGWGSDGSDSASPDGRPRLLPLELPYDPDRGIPPGYKLAEKPRTGLAIAGGVTFGGLWLVSCIAGGFVEDAGQYNNSQHGWPLYIPVIGPLITISTAHSSPAPTTLLVFDSLFQAGSLAMFIAGLASSQKVLKYQFNAGNQLTLRPIASPLENGGFGGLSGSF